MADGNTFTEDILDFLHEGVLICDLDGRIVRWNAALQRLYGWTHAEAAGRFVHDLLQTNADEIGSVEAGLAGAGQWEGELHRKTSDGKQVVVDVRALRRHLPSEGSPRIIEIGRDVTAQHRTENALKLAEYRYQNLFHAMTVSFWELDFAPVGAKVRQLLGSGVRDLREHFARNRDFVRDLIKMTRVIDVNDQTVALFGHGEKRELLGDLARFWPHESTHIFAESVVAAFAGLPHYAAEARFQTLDGRPVDTMFTASFPPEMLARGKIFVGIVDLSTSKKASQALIGSEQRYRKLFEFVPVPLVQFDRNELAGIFEDLHARGIEDFDSYVDAHPDFMPMAMQSIKVIEVNRKMIELLGARRSDELLGPVARLWSEAPATFQRSMGARFAGADRFEAEMKVRAFDGRIIDVIYVTDFPEAALNPALGLACMIDVTDRLKAQHMLAQLQAEFAHAGRVSMLGELTASIAHEVNQPLGAIMTNGEAAIRWLNRPVLDVEELRALSARIIADARRAADIIRRIRDLAVRGEVGRAPTTLNGIVEDVMMFLRPELRRLAVEATLELAPDLPEVFVDRVQLQQVFANIAVNAMQAMTQSTLRPRRLAIRTALRDQATLHAEIEDTGPGIAADDQDHLFDSFFTTKKDGMGIGLAICRSIIEAHGGQIRAGNRSDGQGARFQFTLPKHQP